METVLAGQDKIIIFGNPQTASTAFQQFEIPLDRRDGKISLGAQVSLASFHEKKRKSVTGLEKNPIISNPRMNSYQPLGGTKNPTAKSDYQPLGGGKKSSPQSSTSEYQPLGGTKKASPKNTSTPISDYQPLGGANRKTATLQPNSPSDYQPMGARPKPMNLDNSSQIPSISQYVPRGAARVHPISQTPINESSSGKDENSNEEIKS